jgi:hypothetical protein
VGTFAWPRTFIACDAEAYRPPIAIDRSRPNPKRGGRADAITDDKIEWPGQIDPVDMVVMTKYANVYEHGIEAIDDPPQGLLGLATRENDLIYAGYTLAVLDRDDGSSLNDRVAYLVEVGAYTVSDFYEEHGAKNTA